MNGAGSVKRERRWIVLGEDGRHVAMGRETDPTEEEVQRAEEALASGGTAGWLAVLEGDYWGKGATTLLAVRALGVPASQWQQAVAAFDRRRQEQLGTPGTGPWTA